MEQTLHLGTVVTYTRDRSMSDTAETYVQHVTTGSTKPLTLVIFGLLGLIVLLWSMVLPIIGLLYVFGALS
jgi:hypothetical protein